MYSETKRTRRFKSIHLRRARDQPWLVKVTSRENTGSLEELMQVVLQDGHRLRIQRRVREQLGQVH